MPSARLPRWTAWPLALVSVGLMLAALLLAWIDQVVLVPRAWTESLRASQTIGSFRADLVRITLDHVIDRLPPPPHTLPQQQAPSTQRLHRELAHETLIFASQVFPDDWLVDELERIATVSLHTLRSDDPFHLHISIASRGDIAAQILHDHLHHSYAFHGLYDQLLRLTIHLFVTRNPTLPFGIRADARTLHLHAMRVAPSSWVGRQIAAASQALADYMQGRTPHVDVYLPLHERTQPLKRAIRSLLATAQLRAFLRQRVVRPLVVKHIGERLDIRWGLSLSNQQLVAAFDQALSDAWLDTTRQRVVDAATAYLLDTATPLEIHVPIEPLYEPVAQRTSDIVLDALDQLLSDLPPCPNLNTFRRQLLLTTPPTCQPTGMAAIGIELWIRHVVHTRTLSALRVHVPTTWTYDEAQMRERLSPNTWQSVQAIRSAMTEGLTVNEATLLDTLPKHLHPTLEQILSLLRHGLTLAEPEVLPHLTATQRSTYQNTRRALQILRPAWITGLLLSILLAIGAVVISTNHLLSRLRITAWWLLVIGLGTLLWGVLTHSVLAPAIDDLRRQLPILRRPVYDDLTPQLVRRWMAPWWMLTVSLLTLAILGLAATLRRWYKKTN